MKSFKWGVCFSLALMSTGVFAEKAQLQAQINTLKSLEGNVFGRGMMVRQALGLGVASRPSITRRLRRAPLARLISENVTVGIKEDEGYGIRDFLNVLKNYLTYLFRGAKERKEWLDDYPGDDATVKEKLEWYSREPNDKGPKKFSYTSFKIGLDSSNEMMRNFCTWHDDGVWSVDTANWAERALQEARSQRISGDTWEGVYHQLNALEHSRGANNHAVQLLVLYAYVQSVAEIVTPNLTWAPNPTAESAPYIRNQNVGVDEYDRGYTLASAPHINNQNVRVDEYAREYTLFAANALVSLLKEIQSAWTYQAALVHIG